MLKLGDPAPDFALPGDGGATIALADLRGKSVVLYFYPKDDTPGCTVEANEFSALAERFAAAGAVVLGVSRDSVKAHCRFRDKYGLKVTLLSDADLAVHRAYDAWGTKVTYGKTVEGVIRSTVVIDGAGRVARLYPRVKAAGHAEAVLRELTGEAARATATKPAAR